METKNTSGEDYEVRVGVRSKVTNIENGAWGVAYEHERPSAGSGDDYRDREGARVKTEVELGKDQSEYEAVEDTREAHTIECD